MSHKHIDLTMMSAHVIVDRAERIHHIENSIGWGTIVAEAPDRKEQNATAILTSTGVLVIRAMDGTIITAWVANVKQAVAVWKTAKNGKSIPHWLWNVINYNNNTTYWRNLTAA